MRDEAYYKNFYEQIYKSLKKGLMDNFKQTIQCDIDGLKDLIELIDNEKLQEKFKRRIELLYRNATKCCDKME